MNLDLKGQTILVTGASAGIGRAVAEALVARGASVVLGTRSEARTRPVLDDLKKRYPDADLLWLPLDLAYLRSVENAAETFLATKRPLHVLINNAGVGGARGLTRDGFDMTIGTNHLGPFLLTERLLPRLVEAPAARIVNVASRAHTRVRSIDWEAFTRPAAGARDLLLRYGQSKLMNVLHARELARRLARTGVTTYAVHPGVIASDVWRELPGAIRAVLKLFMRSNEEGAAPVLRCATAPELAKVSGRYYDRLQEVPPNKLAEDDGLADELYRRSLTFIENARRLSETRPDTPGARAG
jgi:retinol dehydrogenase-12